MPNTLSPNELDELARRCEAAEGPDRELDAFIEATVAPERIGRIDLELRAFTASLDAALALCPQGHWWNAGQDTDFAWANLTPWGTDKTIEALNCATPALALCAAALRAQAQGTSK